MNLPFIFLFETYKKQYLYDVNTNSILCIASSLWKALKENQNNPNHVFSEYEEKRIMELQKLGYLSDNHWKTILHPATDIMPFQLSNALAAVVLQVTQVCNLNCSYCPFGQGNYYSRKHSRKQMTNETAAATIDFLVQNSSNSNYLAVGFYGGEPLANFDTVKFTVNYIIEKYSHKKFSYFMTTNATLLDEEKILFLDKHNFSMTISLDGPKEIHDRNRQSFSHESSFDKVMNAIKIISEKYPEFHSRITFNCVIDPNSSFDCFHSFFTSYEEIGEYLCRFSNVSKANLRNDDSTISNDYLTKYNFEIFKSILSSIGKIDIKDVSPIVISYMTDLLQVMSDKRMPGKLGVAGHPGGPCVPGGRKIFVNVDGNMYPCEKVNEMSEEMKIGNIYTGFEIDKCDVLLNVAKLTERECKKCWAGRLCYLCCLFCEKDNTLSADERLKNCNQVKQHLLNYFKIYACLIEHDYNKNAKWFNYYSQE